MGIVRMGAPEKEVSFLKDIMDIPVFFEGGTYQGKTAIQASKTFEMVYTVEKSEDMAQIAEKNLTSYRNIELLRGDTREHLEPTLQKHPRMLFWLDAHWSGGKTYGEGDECPLLEEMQIIFAQGGDLPILIDDARLFLAPPPLPHNASEWPSISEIVRAIPAHYEVFVHSDVIYLLPKGVVVPFREHLQKEVTAEAAEDKTSSRLARIFRPGAGASSTKSNG